MRAQHVQHLRHADDHRNPTHPDLLRDVVRVVAAHEDDSARQHRRDERRHRLAEHVTERQQVQKSHWKQRPGPASILLHFALDRNDIRQDVAMGDDHAFGFTGGARREDDLGDVIAAERDMRR